MHPILSTKKAVPKMYTPINGRLDGLLTEIFIARGWIKPVNKNNSLHYVTPKGEKFLAVTVKEN